MSLDLTQPQKIIQEVKIIPHFYIYIYIYIYSNLTFLIDICQLDFFPC